VSEALEYPRVDAGTAEIVVRLPYSRRQAAEALGISRSTFNRRVLTFVPTIEVGSAHV
jgi:transposase-like protein